MTKHTEESKRKISQTRLIKFGVPIEEQKRKQKERYYLWVAANQERSREIKRNHYHRNKVEWNEKARERGTTPEAKEWRRAYQKKHREQNPDMWASYTVNRRAASKGAVGTHTTAEWRDLVAYFKGACAYCGKRAARLTRDHVIPISRIELSPTNDISNILPACRSCNSQKGAKTDYEFRRWLYDTNAWEGKCFPNV